MGGGRCQYIWHNSIFNSICLRISYLYFACNKHFFKGYRSHFEYVAFLFLISFSLGAYSSIRFITLWLLSLNHAGTNLECYFPNIVFNLMKNLNMIKLFLKKCTILFSSHFCNKKNGLSNSRVCSVILFPQPSHLNYLWVMTERLRVVYI